MALRERCIQDPTFFDQIAEVVRDKHYRMIGDDPFYFAFVDYMCAVGIWRSDNPTYNPMVWDDRGEFNAGKTEMHTEGNDVSSSLNPTPSVRSYSEYLAMRASAPPALSEKGTGKAKGKGKGKGIEKGKDKKRQKQGW